MTVVAAPLVLGGNWITLPKGANVVDVRGVALIVRDSMGGTIVATEEDIAVGLWVGTREIEMKISFSGSARCCGT